MATLAELQGAFDTLADIFRNDLTPRFNAIRRGVDAGDTFAEVGSEINAIRAEFDNAYSRIFQLRQEALQITPRPTDFIARLDRSLNTNQATNNAALSQVEIKARENQTREEQQAQTPTGPTAGAEVAGDDTNNPVAPPAQTVADNGEITTPRADTAPSNAVVTPTAADGDVDTGTDAPTRSLSQTQQVNDWSEPGAVPGVTVSDRGQAEPGAVPGVTVSDRDQTDPGFDPRLSASATPGAGANDDDQAPTTGTTQAQVNADQAAVISIQPRDNILDRFHNYTYNASVYVLTPEQFALYQQQPKKTISGYNLLFQSGGAPTGSGQRQGAVAGRADSNIQDNRNPAFPLDYYIDSIQIENLALGKATQAAHSVTNLKITVVEPGNISLLDNIYRAVQDLNPELSGKINYAAAIYMLVIRFYGYDLDGKPVRVGSASENTTQTDPDAVVEKFIPFRIKQIDWSVSNQLVNYQIQGVAVGHIVAGATRRGTIPADIQLSGATVQDMLQGPPVYSAKQAPPATPGASTTAGRAQQTDPGEIPGVTVFGSSQATDTGAQAPPKAPAAAQKTGALISGLIAVMNAQQQEKVSKKEILVADEYVVEFGPGAEKIASARVTKPGNKVAKDTTSGSVPASKGNTSSRSPDKQNMNVNSRNFAIPAGTQLLQAIDQIIRNSNYITDQALFVFNEKTNKPEPAPPKPNQTPGFQWFNILMQATPKEYDTLRNDFAFKIKYTIIPYTPQEFFSQFFPVPIYRGVHKRYPYWFTGENTQVLDYQASFNKLFTVTVSGGGPGDNPLAQFRNQYSTSMRDYPFFQTQARSTESDVGADGRANELAANAAEYLYNPSDNAQAKIKILGDPAWIQQGSSAGLTGAAYITTEPFNADGTINFDVNDVLFEIAWQRPEDYNSETGLADPYSRTQRSFEDRQPLQSVIYRARKCTSYFNQGRFEQDLEGTLYWFPLPDGSNRVIGAATPPAGNNPDEISDALPAGVTAGNNKLSTFADSSGSTYSLLQQSAKSQTGSLGLRIPDSLKSPVTNLGTGQFTFPESPLPLPVTPPSPPTSDGQDVGTQDILEAERINLAAGTDQITAEQVSSNRRLNQLLSAPFSRAPSTDTPQDIARES